MRFLILLLIVILLFHAIATNFSLYWKYRWIDIIPHIFGGIWLGSLMIWYVYFSGKVATPKSPVVFVFLIILGAAALGGVLWEFFEFLFDQFIAKKIYIDSFQAGLKNTISDLFFDLFGGLVAVLYFLKQKNAAK